MIDAALDDLSGGAPVRAFESLYEADRARARIVAGERRSPQRTR